MNILRSGNLLVLFCNILLASTSSLGSETIKISADNVTESFMTCKEGNDAPHPDIRYLPTFKFKNKVYIGPWYDLAYCYYLTGRIHYRAARPQGTYVVIEGERLMFEDELETWFLTSKSFYASRAKRKGLSVWKHRRSL